jgi:hypothetical protein
LTGLATFAALTGLTVFAILADGRLFRSTRAAFDVPVRGPAVFAPRAFVPVAALARVAVLCAAPPVGRAGDARRTRFLARGWALAA